MFLDVPIVVGPRCIYMCSYLLEEFVGLFDRLNYLCQDLLLLLVYQREEFSTRVDHTLLHGDWTLRQLNDVVLTIGAALLSKDIGLAEPVEDELSVLWRELI